MGKGDRFLLMGLSAIVFMGMIIVGKGDHVFVWWERAIIWCD
jgi:hypothetical protein